MIEGKYFRKGSYGAAQSELIRDIYQCFYYRGLPRMPEIGTYAEWNYDYGCLMAYDASDDGNLSRALKGLNKNNKFVNGLWQGANVYVMVIWKKD